MSRHVAFGDRFPLGVTWNGSGVNVAVYSESADSVEFCLFDEDDSEERIELPGRTAHVHYGYVDGVEPGSRYGFRVHGEWAPGNGVYANPAKLLIDPYARAIEGQVRWDAAVFGYDLNRPSEPSLLDSAPFVPRSIVVDNAFDWDDDASPGIPWHQTVLYETHVRGLTKLHPEVPAELRGTYAGMATQPIVDYLVELGVTAIELMPVHHFIPEGFLIEKGLTNYWGYSTAGFFAPHAAYSSAGQRGEQVNEFKNLVKTLHAAGLEVILDVVYNHTTEGNPTGPTVSLRGIDNATYYRLSNDDPAWYLDFTGTGNSLNVRHPASLQLMMDSLRYWVTDMHVDGFRFDLASTLARDFYDFDAHASFFALVHQDPVVSRVKLIAEPWDVGPGGYRLGQYPPIWSEWNDRYRDDVRDFWRSQPGSMRSFATRVTGSSDLYDNNRRRPTASVNYVTSHDGFTLADLVSYDHPHNHANGEDNLDGHRHGRSWNGGVEGPTDDPEVLENRRRRSFSLLATLMLSQGVPMLLGGDEMGRTQQGNNNAFNQDNEISWYNWHEIDEELLRYTRRLIELRREHPVFRRRRFFTGESVLGSSLDDIGWFRADGAEMTHDDWADDSVSMISVFLNGQGLGAYPPETSLVADKSFLIMFNGGADSAVFTVPKGLGGHRWRVVLDTSDKDNRGETVAASDDWKVGSWTVVLLEQETVSA